MSQPKGSNNNNPAISANTGNFNEEKNSFINKDRIWRSHCDQMALKDKLWSETWGFLTDRTILDEHRKKKGIQLVDETATEEVTKDIPPTTARQIGWRSGDDALKLEKYGRYTKPKISILRSLNWPPEAVG